MSKPDVDLGATFATAVGALDGIAEREFAEIVDAVCALDASRFGGMSKRERMAVVEQALWLTIDRMANKSGAADIATPAQDDAVRQVARLLRPWVDRWLAQCEELGRDMERVHGSDVPEQVHAPIDPPAAAPVPERHLVVARSVTAVVMSREPLRRRFDFALPVHNVVAGVVDHAGLYAARLRSLAGVRTPWCTWLDDDDDLPGDIASVVSECIELADAAGAALAYFAELVNDPAGQYVRPAPRPYEAALHLHNPLYVHRALMRTDAARDVIAALPPTGDYWAEHAVFYMLAERGAVALDRVGYVWNVHDGGVHRWRDMAHMQGNTVRMLEAWQAGRKPSVVR